MSFSEQAQRSACNRDLMSMALKVRQEKDNLKYQLMACQNELNVANHDLIREKERYKVSQTGQSPTQTGICLSYGKTGTVPCIYNDA